MAEAVTCTAAPEIAAKLRRIERKLPGAIMVALDQSARYLRDWMRANMLSGQRLRAPTGHLSGSWHVRPYGPSAVILGTPCKYARVHEYGFRGVVYVHEYPRKTASAGKKAKRRGRGGRPPGAKKYDVVRHSSGRKFVGGITGRRMDVGGGASQAMRDRAFKNRNAKLWSSRSKSKSKRVGFTQVRAHNRRMNLRARWYLRDTIRSQKAVAFYKGFRHVERLVATGA